MILFKNQRERIAARILSAFEGTEGAPIRTKSRDGIARWLAIMPGAQVVPRFLFDLALWDLWRDDKLRRSNGGFVAVG